MAAPMQRSMLKLLRSTSTGLKRSFCVSNRVTASSFSVPSKNYSTEPHYSKYGGRTTVTALTGDGVGPELLSYVQEVFRNAGVPVDFEELEINGSTTDENTLRSALLSVQRNGIALKGNIESKFDEPGFRSMNVELRTKLELFASVVWCKSIPGVYTRHKGLDIIMIRENTEGEYSNLEYEIVPGCIENLKIITEAKSTKIAKYAFEFAKTHGRKKVTAIHKANIMKLGDGLFLDSCRKVASQYPDIAFNDMIVDNASMQMVSKPHQFDVLVMPNLYGNILSNITAGLVGGSGVVSGMNIGDDYAVFEMGTRSSGRSLKGKNIANPTGMLLASCDMLDYIGYNSHAGLIRDSVMKVMSEDKVQTPDLGGQATTLEVVQAIIEDIKPKTSSWSSTAAQNVYSLR
uniref:Isocitrate dehydrogenase [NAD] subunit gamma, mitochondrial-like isoform X1 n=2 Tax=Crassostrea virginica TaxID=6565 RepID=A0A8B8BG21_CRAVI|nr:isocitrate dehydrogenase [NAD] subunit gamma, mitochondrial-like isoform X1 [Crassostrea virginica]XP_022301967.1 isocitrate dehydrogenase [NAD] subunit gamma, mitochondrial-like isoform X1 [Crassostrea virginica]XP_022301968.1 isocitrate dehydrogenase [NAD] subunit gamma, mitochondrial-like isoform X1 [Crassostrea virginica]XP_022301969.1 isocitrate dehydrogenase [NAD] subunit gamma, mitochondrial-like isoform X1 [Crassostrea virginica]